MKIDYTNEAWIKFNEDKPKSYAVDYNEWFTITNNIRTWLILQGIERFDRVALMDDEQYMIFKLKFL